MSYVSTEIIIRRLFAVHSFAYNRDTDEYLLGTTTGVQVWKISQVNRNESSA